jgi:hypothetical protein
MPCPMLYGSCLCDYVPYAHGLRSGPTEWIIPQISCKRKLASCLSYSEHWINFRIIYYLLYMLIMQECHNSDHMHNFGHMPDYSQKIWLRSYIMTPVVCVTPVVWPTLVGRYDSGRISWLRSYALDRMPDSDRKIWLRSYLYTPVRRYHSGRISRLRSPFPTLVDITSSDVSPDSGCASQLRSISTSPVLPPQL